MDCIWYILQQSFAIVLWLKVGQVFSLQTQISGCIVQPKHVIDLLCVGVVPSSLHKTIQTSYVVFT